MITNLGEQMNQFRIASRELFNHFFRIRDPYGSDQQQAWLNEERFGEVQIVLFQKLVAEPLLLDVTEYGCPQPNILVMPGDNADVSIMLNREKNTGVFCGYWDYPLNKINKNSRLLFVDFFDWDQLDYRDNQYVRVLVDDSPAHPDIVGRYGLIESSASVCFVKPA